MSQVTAGEAKHAARAWVEWHGSALPGFVGAFTTGSVNVLTDDAVIPAASDVDVMIVLRDTDIGQKPGKVHLGGTLVELGYLALEEIVDPERVLAHYHLAWSVRGTTILADPDGLLAPMKAEVVRRFAHPEWVDRRIEHATATVAGRVETIGKEGSLESRAMSWLFAAGGVPHILLVAGLRNPTVRKRYLAVREMLDERGRDEVYPDLLEMLGCRDWSSERTTRHLDALEPALDAAGRAVRSPFPFAADLLPDAKSIAIGGSRELIAEGNHREAVFWIGATWCRCMLALHADAPDSVAYRWDDAFAAFLADLGIRSVADLERRGEEIRTALPGIRAVANGLSRVSLATE